MCVDTEKPIILCVQCTSRFDPLKQTRKGGTYQALGLIRFVRWKTTRKGLHAGVANCSRIEPFLLCNGNETCQDSFRVIFFSCWPSACEKLRTDFTSLCVRFCVVQQSKRYVWCVPIVCVTLGVTT